MPDAPSSPARSVSRRRALTLGAGAMLAAVAAAGGAVGVARRGASLPAVADPADDEPWPPPRIGVSDTEPTEFHFTFDTDVSKEDEQLLRDGAVLARDFYFKTLGVYLTGRPIIHVEGRAVRAWDALGDADGRTIRIYSAEAAWPHLDPADKVEVIAHEIFHLMQTALSGGVWPAALYLVEGTAEYAAHSAVVDAGMRTLDAVRERATRVVRGYPQPPIGRVNRDSGGGNYPVSFLAIDQLVGARGPAPLGAYFRLLGQRDLPSDAFLEAFGESREAFEDRFERWRVSAGIPAR